MERMKRHIICTAIASSIFLTFGGIMGMSSCQTATEPPTETTTFSIPPKYPPAYFIEIEFTDETTGEGDVVRNVTVAKGASTTLPVMITSRSEVPIYIRPALFTEKKIPDSITFETQKEYIILEPEESIELTVTFTVGEDTATGDYYTGIYGELKEPVEERATMGQDFRLIIIDSQS
jgi:hypothetical protein